MLTLRQVERHLDGAADILRFNASAAEMRSCLVGTLLLKHCSDEHDALLGRPAGAARPPFTVPPAASWRHLESKPRDAGTARMLDEALRALEAANPALDGAAAAFRFTRAAGPAASWDATLGRLIGHFSRVRLASGDFEFPDLPGAAYEYLLTELTGSGGKTLGEFYTPRGVAVLMTRLAGPRPGASVYDPCCGSGGLLACAADEAAADWGGVLQVHGQDLNPASVAIAKVNMMLRGAPADLRAGDTLASPAHLAPDGSLARFDRVLANPPFSSSYRRGDLTRLDRFTFGWPPETGKKADLLFAQHVLAVLQPGGLGAVVMPHGVLFRGGREQDIRREIIAADRLAAVIGLPANLFYGTAIPACVLILRGPAPRPRARQGQVLFVNAEREYTPGRVQDRLDDSHIAKIELAWREFRDVPGFARVVTAAELKDAGWNLNIRRYVDPSPPPEPQDLGAHLHGGVPDAEIAGHRDRFAAYGIDVTALFSPAARRPGYRDFPGGGWEAAASQIPALAARRQEELGEAFSTWWEHCSRQLTGLAGTGMLAGARRSLTGSFTAALEPQGTVSRHGLAGVIAGWLEEFRYDLRVLANHGFSGVAGSWLAAALDPGPGRTAGETRLAQLLAPDLLGEAEAARSRRDGLAAQVAAATAAPEGTGDDEDPGDVPDGFPVPAGRVRELRADLAAARKTVKESEGELPTRLQARAAALDAAGQQEMVLSALRAGLAARLDAEFAAGVRGLSERYRTWAGKYAVSLREIEKQRGEAEARVMEHLAALGYAAPPAGRREPPPAGDPDPARPARVRPPRPAARPAVAAEGDRRGPAR